MFEDSTFESTGRIRTHSRGWMLAALCFNGTILLAMVLIPLLYPEALTRVGTIAMIDVPPPPPPAAKTQPVQARPARGLSEMSHNELLAPRRIPILIAIFRPGEDRAPDGDFDGIKGALGDANSANPFPNSVHVLPHVRPASNAPLRLSSMVVEGLIVRKTLPVYPPIARAVHVEGTVILQAAISTAGTIEKLRVVGGPAMLRQAALDAVRDWRYRPYELNGEPVEVETTINVIFVLGR